MVPTLRLRSGQAPSKNRDVRAVTSLRRRVRLAWAMPRRLHRYYGSGYAHFITTKLLPAAALPGESAEPGLFLRVLEQVRRRYGFVVIGYVVMPEHIHLLIGEPERGNPSVVMQAVKQGFARRLRRRLRMRSDPRQCGLWSIDTDKAHVWQRRFYDFVVWSERKRTQKLLYMHHNPVMRGLVLEPGQWRWSSFRHYAYGERGPVLVNEQRPRGEMKIRVA